MERDDKQECVGLEMPNGLASNVKYPQKFNYSPYVNHHGKSNEAAKKAPSEARVMAQVLDAKKG